VGVNARGRGTASTPRRPGWLHPTGTARALFSSAAAPDDAHSADTLPRAVWERLRARDVRAETLLAAWEVSGWPDAPLAERRALAAVMVAVGETTDAGGTYLDLDGDRLRGRLERLGFDGSEAGATVAFAARLRAGDVAPSLRTLFGGPGDRRPFVLAAEGLYPEALWTLEARLAALLSERLAATPTGDAPPALRDGSALGLGAEQAAAVAAAAARPLTLITGGPGTGKTSTIVAFLRALFQAGVRPAEVAVAAPTGRAAQRITEALQAARPDGDAAPPGALTVHRLLGLRPARRPTLTREAPEYHRGWRLPHRFVIVDEASMVDLDMMTQLAAAVRDDARLILVGDADQLPSVRLGAVFRDLCAALPQQTQRLTTSYRMDPADRAGAAILRVARALQSGTVPEVPSRRRVHELTWSGVEHLAGSALPELLARWSEELTGGAAPLEELASCSYSPLEDGRLASDAPLGPLRAVLERHARARLLCVTRSVDDQTSADALNALMHGHFVRQRRTGGVRNDQEEGLLPGEPVTILRNDYQRSLWNGDQGVVVAQSASGGDPLGVAFARADGIVIHGLGELADNVGLGYALTVHKAQGSEYDRVALVLPAGDGPLLTREILYTALTRARRAVVLVGDLALFDLAARRKLERASGLGSKLAAAAASSRPRAK